MTDLGYYNVRAITVEYSSEKEKEEHVKYAKANEIRVWEQFDDSLVVEYLVDGMSGQDIFTFLQKPTSDKYVPCTDKWDIEAQTGYKPLTYMYEELSTLDSVHDMEGIKQYYDKALNDVKDDYKLLTELVMVLNWKIWYWFNKDLDLADLYTKLWHDADAYVMDNLKGEELSYFLNTTD